MTATLNLLRKTPEEGLKYIIQSQLNPGFSVDYFTHGNPVAVEGGKTLIELYVNKAKAPINYWGYTGSFDFEYQRLDLNTIFDPLEMELRVDFPVTQFDILNKLTEKYDIVFDDNDCEQGTLDFDEGDVFVLTAKSHSLRWYGEVLLSVKQRILSLTEVFPITNLPTLDYNDAILDTKTVLLSMLNSLNDDGLYRDLTMSEIQFSEVVKLSDNDIELNSGLTISVTTSDLYTGSLLINYQRYYAPRMSDYEPIDIVSNTVSTTRQLAVVMASELNIYLNPNDIVDDILPYTQMGETSTVTLYVIPDSLTYTGEFTVNWTRGQIDV